MQEENVEKITEITKEEAEKLFVNTDHAISLLKQEQYRACLVIASTDKGFVTSIDGRMDLLALSLGELMYSNEGFREIIREAAMHAATLEMVKDSDLIEKLKNVDKKNMPQA